MEGGGWDWDIPRVAASAAAAAVAARVGLVGAVEERRGDVAVGHVQGGGEKGRRDEEKHVLQQPGVEGRRVGVSAGALEVPEDKAWSLRSEMVREDGRAEWGKGSYRFRRGEMG